MSHYYMLDQLGEVVPTEDVIQWAHWMEDPDNGRILRQDRVGDVFLSTVFLGLDYSHGFANPVLWETMAFKGDTDIYQRRYTRLTEATETHDWLLQKLHEGVDISGYNE